jgi:hypothetical protein
MPIPPPPPGFTLDTPSVAPPMPPGRPVIRKGVTPPTPDLPQGYGMTGGTAAPVRACRRPSRRLRAIARSRLKSGRISASIRTSRSWSTSRPASPSLSARAKRMSPRRRPTIPDRVFQNNCSRASATFASWPAAVVARGWHGLSAARPDHRAERGKPWLGAQSRSRATFCGTSSLRPSRRHPTEPRVSATCRTSKARR